MTDHHVSPIPREARPYQGHRAGLVTRFIASAIDGLVVLAVVLAGYGALAVAVFLVEGRNFVFPDTSLVVNMVTSFAVLVVYPSLAWAISGRTYGCHVIGLRVVSANGNRLRPTRAVLRALLCAFLPIGLFWAAVNRRNHSVQDLLLRTQVVYDWEPRGSG
ncbi:MAG: RDD family protein [Nocardioidaceae bacterium]